MSGFNNKIAQKCCIYWDYENCPIPKRSTRFGNVHAVIKRRIYEYLQCEVPIESRIYIAAKKLPQKVKEQIAICSAENVDIPSWKPEAVDKRILVDLALDLYKWKGHNICNAVVLISGDKDFGNILGKIHNAPEIAKLILIRLPKDNGLENPINKNLYTNVDYIIDSNQGNGFKVEEFIDCKHGNNCHRAFGECIFYHHQQHYQNKIQTPVSSVSNMSISGGNHDEKKQMDQKTLEIRKKIPCQYGNKCKNWKKGNCHFLHYKTCKFGNGCSFWKKGICRNFHPHPYTPPMSVPSNIVQQQLYQQQLAQQQQQQIEFQLNQMNNQYILNKNGIFSQQQQPMDPLINPGSIVGGIVQSGYVTMTENNVYSQYIETYQKPPNATQLKQFAATHGIPLSWKKAGEIIKLHS